MQTIRLVLSITGLFVASISFTNDLRAQSGSYGVDPIRTWQHSSWGLSPNASLARYRLRGAGHTRLPATPRWRRPQLSRGTLYSAPYYAITAPWATPNLRSNPYPAVDLTSTRKPFAGIQPGPTAVDRYWSLLYEAREDPKTGLIIWSLP